MNENIELLFQFVRKNCENVPGFKELDDSSKERIVAIGSVFLACAFVDKFLKLVDEIKETNSCKK